MDRSRLRPAVALVLVVVAVATAAGAIGDSSEGGSSEGVGSGDGSGVGFGSGDGLGLGGASPQQYSVDGTLFAYFIGAVVVLGVVFLVGRTVLLAYVEDWEGIADELRTAALALVVGVVAVAAVYALVQGLDLGELLANGGGDGLMPDDGDGETSPGTGESWLDAPTDPRVAVLVLVLAIGLAFAISRGDRESAPFSSSPIPTRGVGGSGDGSGGAPAVDRVADDVPASNGVYRAWLAMAEAADVDADRRSPEAVRRRAIDAGVDEATAEELTELFVEVRYGTAAPTADREGRAERAAAGLPDGEGQ